MVLSCFPHNLGFYQATRILRFRGEKRSLVAERKFQDYLLIEGADLQGVTSLNNDFLYTCILKIYDILYYIPKKMPQA